VKPLSINLFPLSFEGERDKFEGERDKGGEVSKYWHFGLFWGRLRLNAENRWRK
jgi:hypothetical protein